MKDRYEAITNAPRRAGKTTMHSLESIIVRNNLDTLVGRYVRVRHLGKILLIKIESYGNFYLKGTIQENKPEVSQFTFHYSDVEELLPEGNLESLILLYGEGKNNE